MLHPRTVEAGLQRQAPGMRYGVRRDQPRPEWRRRRKVLAGGDRLLLEIPHTPVVEARIAGHHCHRVCLADMPSRTPDDHGELSFKIQALGHRWAHDGLPMADQVVGKPGKESGRCRGTGVCLPRVLGVVESHGKDLARVWNGRQ